MADNSDQLRRLNRVTDLTSNCASCGGGAMKCRVIFGKAVPVEIFEKKYLTPVPIAREKFSR